MGTIEGGCLCGAVTYSSPAEPVMTAICHCTDCQKQSGSAFSLVVVAPKDGFEVTGEPAVFETIGEETGKPNLRHFCANCGSPLWSDSPLMPGMVIVKAGTLNDTSGLQPALEVWGRSAHDWVGEAPEGRMRVPTGPPAG